MLRRLEEKDADAMLEWMQDEEITCNFRVPFATFSREKVLQFISNSFDNCNQHFAVVDDNDEYLGTISLKNISVVDRNAEYAIVLRKAAQGTGIAYHATNEIVKYAFDTLGLHKIYLNVLTENRKAIALYEHVGFKREGQSADHVCLNGEYRDLYWYAIINNMNK